MNRLEKVGLNDAVRAAFAELQAEQSAARLGRVTRVDRGECEVLTVDGPVRAVSDSMRSQRATAPVTGDWVAVVDDDDVGWAVRHIFDRTTAIVRRDPAENATDQVLVSNIDRVAVVHALDHTPNEARVERFVVLAIDSGAEPLVVLNKSDTSALVAEQWEWLADVAPVVVTSAVDGTGIEELRSHIGDQETIVFIGPSGVGKSTLINALIGDEVVATGAVREGDRRGRHTTTVRELIELPSGGLLIDTPGIRSVGLWAADIALDAVFADIAELAVGCRFRDCTHRSEPGCAVGAAVDDGTINSTRLARYQLLWQELAEQAEEVERQQRKPSRGRRRRRR